VTQATYLAAVWSFPVFMTYAALHDLFSFTIPNWIPVVVVCGFFLVALSKGGLWSLPTLLHVSTGLAVLAAFAFLFFRGLLGGGDAKLIAAASVWMGWPQLGPFLLLMALAGGVLALAWFVARRVTTGAMTPAWAGRYFTSARGVPYGVAIGFAGVAMFVTQDWVEGGLLGIWGPVATR
jgi:prepilin peptidase CpaA